MFGLDPGKHTFGLSCFVDGHLHAMTTIVPKSRSEVWGYVNGEALKRRVLIDNEGKNLVDFADWCGLESMSWMTSIWPTPRRDAMLISEYPQIYRHGKNDKNDLLALADCVSAVEAFFGLPCERVLPRDWKHNIDGDVFLSRIKKKLGPEEEPILKEFEGRVKSKGLQSHAVDAVGLGLWKLGRL